LSTAADAWDQVAVQLESAAASYNATVAELMSVWQGRSSESMATAVAPYIRWMHTTAGQAERTAAQARAAAAAFEQAHASVVQPEVVEANRAQLASLVATNYLGVNVPAIAATEAEYGRMWAHDSAVMFEYAAASAEASKLTPFTDPATMLTNLSKSPATGAVSLLNTWSTPLSNLAALSRTWSSAGSFATGVARPAEPVRTIPFNPASPFGLPGFAGVSRPLAQVGTVTAVVGRASPVGALSVPPRWAAGVVAANPGAVSGSSGMNVAAVAKPDVGGVPIPTGPGVGPVAGVLGRHSGGVLRAPLLATYRAVPRQLA
jgi:hypothetical protein